MDRRQRKTREAIFRAFSALLSEHNFNHITVQDILERADVGRSTFYAHFETKDFLLRELCAELFGHVTDSAAGPETAHLPFDCTCAADSVFLHLLRHLQENALGVLDLLASQNNGIFLRYFKDDVKKLVLAQYAERGLLDGAALPQDYLVNHIASSFVETLEWWLRRGRTESPEQLTEYFLAVIEPLLKE